MKRLVAEAPTQGFQAIYLTVEGATDEADFVQRPYRAVAEKDPRVIDAFLSLAKESVFHSLIKRVRKVGAMGVSVELSEQARKNWADSVLTLGNALARIETPWLLAVDELPLFVLKLLRADDSGERAALFLHRLRELRQNQPQLRWLLAGSIGLDTVTGRYNLGDTINDLQMTGLGPFAEETAENFLRELATSYGVTLPPQVCNYIIEHLEWLLPYYLQLIFSELLDHIGEGEKSPNPETVDSLFERLLEPANKNYSDYWRQRLHEELGSPDDDFAITLLNAICHAPEGAGRQILQGALAQRIHEPDQRDRRLRYLLDILENDGYLIQISERYRFRLPLLREYWRRRVAQ